jgi:hypothetical protein
MGAALQSLLRAELPAHRLPRLLHIWDLREPYGELRSSTEREGVEYGACTVVEPLRLDLTHQVRGTETSITPDCRSEGHDWYAGFAHTHLPDWETGQPYMGFSDQDYRATLADGEILSLVCNGPEVFALVRSSDCTSPRRRIGRQEFEEWCGLYDAAISKARREIEETKSGDQSDALDRCLWEVNREICRRLGLAFYQGRFGEPLQIVYRPMREE